MSSGTYIGGAFSASTIAALIKFSETNNIPNIVDEVHHVTILYNTQHVDIIPRNTNYPAKPINFHVFNNKFLVIMLDSSELTARHNSIMHEYKCSHDYPNYNPHITLSCDIGDFDVSTLNIKDLDNINFNITHEYYESLDVRIA